MDSSIEISASMSSKGVWNTSAPLGPEATYPSVAVTTQRSASPNVIYGAAVSVSAVFVLVMMVLLILKKRRMTELRNRSARTKRRVSGGISRIEKGDKSPTISVISTVYEKEECESYTAARPKQSLSNLQTDQEPQPLPRRKLMSRTFEPLSIAVSHNDIPNKQARGQFNRGDPYRRSNSLESLPMRPNPNNPLAKTTFTSSQDSGIGDSMLLSTPTSVASVPALIWSPDRMDPVTAMQNTIQGFLKQFKEIPDRLQGYCYASTFFAVGEFDGRGGMLFFKDSEPAKLLIPPGALSRSTVVYMMVQYEESISSIEDLSTSTLSPVFECGPDGLQFQVPVELTIPHAACPGSEVSAVSRSPNTTNWKEDTARDGPSFVQTSTDTVTLQINHFTGFKLSDTDGKRTTPSGKSSTTRSRIPLPLRTSHRTQSSRRQAGSQNGKQLSVAVFKYGDKAKVYFATNSKNFQSLTDSIDHREARHGFMRESDWKDFSFLEEKGGLSITARKGQTLYKQFNMNDRKVMNAHYDCVEIIAADDREVLDITVNQPSDPEYYSQFCIKLISVVSPAHESYSAMLSRVEYTMSTLELQRVSPFAGGYLPTESNNNITYGRSGNDNNMPYDRSISNPVSSHDRSFSETVSANGRYPEESCDHEGACMCWKDSPTRCPTESSLNRDNNLRPLKRNNTTRSQESGYESANSPISPLKGPETLSQNISALKGPESLAQASGSISHQRHSNDSIRNQESMTLHFNSVGGNLSSHTQPQGGARLSRPVAAPRLQANQGPNATNV